LRSNGLERSVLEEWPSTENVTSLIAGSELTKTYRGLASDCPRRLVAFERSGDWLTRSRTCFPLPSERAGIIA
jgi:hypothetical protein